eukprot:CAMPEP_0170185824 /NCGR_PEP_ID=MMETSP0040_2-20121228/37587_1 /TAXON_ID=641309 /ORGANISM="Lotharella oceanica, Strain CCMP622" /LENGTH=162 /DNA_ID=CAMNT_0010432361 /DNA_START=222 /DNA_END=710 /DNA_ORIENTATION=-
MTPNTHGYFSTAAKGFMVPYVMSFYVFLMMVAVGFYGAGSSTATDVKRQAGLVFLGFLFTLVLFDTRVSDFLRPLVFPPLWDYLFNPVVNGGETAKNINNEDRKQPNSEAASIDSGDYDDDPDYGSPRSDVPPVFEEVDPQVGVFPEEEKVQVEAGFDMSNG